MSDSELLRTPLHELHRALGAKMVAFAGYDMPVSYPAGIKAEHLQCRRSAALFDVSHMGQIRLVGPGAALALESLVPVDVAGLAVGQQRYALFTNDQGGIEDDLMVTRREQDLLLVVNASRKADDLAHLESRLGHLCDVVALPDQALIALQGPSAATVLARLNPALANLRFMQAAPLQLQGADCFVSRSGYTGEDGFEISVPAERALDVATALLDQAEVATAGLGARDTLRLEAGLCLYGHDIDSSTTPIEAGLQWALQKVRRAGGARHGGYPGATIIDAQIAHGSASRRVGLAGTDRVPVREGAELLDEAGNPVGKVTSGTWAPGVERVIAMGYVSTAHAAIGSQVFAVVRGKPQPMVVTGLPFAPHRYVRL